MPMPKLLNASAAALALSLALVVSACASSGSSSGTRASSSTRLEQADLESVQQLDAYQAIQRLRRLWLQPRGGISATFPVVYVDGQRRGGVDELRSIPVLTIGRIEYMNSSDATTRYGTGHDGGAILVTRIR